MIESLAMMSALAAAAPLAVSQPRFTLICDENSLSQNDANFGGGFRQSSKSKTQEYGVDLTASAVTSRFAYKSDAQPWVESPATSSTFLRTPGGRLVFCMAQADYKCGQENVRSTPTGGTINAAPEAIVINVKDGSMTGFSFMSVKATDGSWMQTATQITGRCRNKPASRS